MTRQTLHRFRRATTLCAFALSLTALAQSQPVQPPGPLGSPPFHLVAPVDKFPQPDYFAHAVKLTKFEPGVRFKTLKLTSPIQPEVLVLPVQAQAFGWTPAFSALAAASLDHALSVRGVNANRQTDLFDVDGPYVRRFDATDIQSFAGQYPKADVLALYLGRDGIGKVFVTLTLRRGERQSQVHRTLPDQQEAMAVLSGIAASFTPMLTELGLGRAGAETTGGGSCDMQDWRLPDPSSADRPAQRACRALVLGTLLPELDQGSYQYSSLLSPAKVAWLAQAYAEASALAPPVASAIQALAWTQLGLDSGNASRRALADVGDPVLRPLSRLVAARSAAESSPVRSPDEAVQAAAADAARELPPFTSAVFMERARYDETFRRVDLCAIELKLPWMRLPDDCQGMEDTQESRRRIPATFGERMLVEEWRLAKSYKALLIEGVFRAAPQARRAVIERMPARIAAQPFIRQLMFATERFDEATGSFDELVTRSTAAVHDAVQSMVDSQRLGSARALERSVSTDRWTRNPVLTEQRAIRLDSADERRLMNVLNLDGFGQHYVGCCRLAANSGLEFLLSGDGRAPIAVTSTGVRIRGTEQVVAPTALAKPLLPHFNRPDKARSDLDLVQLEEVLADAPENMELRMEVAVARMKTGQSVEAARKFIDQRHEDRRVDQAISESHSWALPAHAFFFSGELRAARAYYGKVAKIGTASGSDLQARVRLPLIDGDIKTAMERTEERLERYENDFARRDLAGLRFLLGQGNQAWEALKPRLAQSGEMELWTGVQVGHRLHGAGMREVKEWLTRSGYGHARVSGVDVGAVFLARYVTDDRLPSEQELAALDAELANAGPSGNLLRAHARLQRLAFDKRVDQVSIQEVGDLVTQSLPQNARSFMKPLYAWSAWRATEGKDPGLAGMTDATLESDLDSLLAKAMILGLQGDVPSAIAYLRAARIELSQLGFGRLHSDLRSAEYTVALCAYLLHTHTGDVRYRDEALKTARPYQRIFPFLAWPYALDALLSPPGAARTLATCRARYLDAQSQFLSTASLPKEPCRRNLW